MGKGTGSSSLTSFASRGTPPLLRTTPSAEMSRPLMERFSKPVIRASFTGFFRAKEIPPSMFLRLPMQ